MQKTIGQYKDYLLFLMHENYKVFKIQKFNVYTEQRSDVFSWLNGAIEHDVAYAAWPERNLIALGLDRDNVYVLTKGLESEQSYVVHCKYPDDLEKDNQNIPIHHLEFAKNHKVLFCSDYGAAILKWSLDYPLDAKLLGLDATQPVVIEDTKVLSQGCPKPNPYANYGSRFLVVDQQSRNLYCIHSASQKIACIDQKDDIHADIITSSFSKDLLPDRYHYYKYLTIINGKLFTCISNQGAEKVKVVSFNLDKKCMELDNKSCKKYELPESIFPNSLSSSPDQKYLMIDSAHDHNISLFYAGSMKHMQTIQFPSEEANYTENFYSLP
ncbi:MAG: hypothetical protein AAF380_00900, partial [Bacteroidota bacterium]